MTLSIILIAVGAVGLVVLFYVRDWQNKMQKDLTHSISGKFESHLKVGAQKSAIMAKSALSKTLSTVKEKGINGIRGVKRTSISQMVRGRKKLNENNGNGSKFLNDVREAKEEVRNGR